MCCVGEHSSVHTSVSDVEVPGGRACLSYKQEASLLTLTAARLVRNGQATRSNSDATQTDRSPVARSCCELLHSSEKEETPSTQMKRRDVTSKRDGTRGRTCVAPLIQMSRTTTATKEFPVMGGRTALPLATGTNGGCHAVSLDHHGG